MHCGDVVNVLADEVFVFYVERYMTYWRRERDVNTGANRRVRR